MADARAAWVKNVLNLDVHAAPAAGAAKQPELAGAGAQPAGAAAPGSEMRVGALPALVLPAVIAGAKELLGRHVCHVTITNETDLTLTLDPSSVKPESGEYKKQPKSTLKPGDATEFEVDSKTVAFGLGIGAVEGTLRYLSATPKLSFTCHYHNPRLLANDADGHVDPTSDKYGVNASSQGGDDAPFTFTLTGGGGGVAPKPSGGDSGVAASCRVSVVNQTQQTVFLRKQDKAAGDYVTNPATSLAAGATTSFVFAETPNSTDHGCRGLMTWEVGDPKQATWSLMFDNVKGGKNLSASFLDPKDGGLHTLDQIDEGDENVPVTFTLSGGGGAGPGPGPGPQPSTGKPMSCVIVVENKTNLVANLLAADADDGSFDTPVPKTLAAGATIVVKMTGPADATKPAKGAMAWMMGDPGAGDQPSWVFDWTNPPGAKNTASGSVASNQPGLLTSEEVGDGDQDVAYTFSLLGQLQPTPPGPATQPTSCAIMVTNSTQSVLTLAGQVAKQGEFAKAPPKTLAAGASALVTFKGAADKPDQGASGSMSWTMGNPAITTWSLEWNNPPGDGNTARADFTPDVSGLSSDASVQPKGDDDVPFTYILSGGPKPPVQGTKTSCDIAIQNDGAAALTLVSSKADSGTFAKLPPNVVAPGASVQVRFEGPDDGTTGAVGSLVWQVGDDAKATSTMSWTNPPGVDNTAKIDFAGTDPAVSGTAVAGKGDADVPFTFDVKGSGPPKPNDKDDDFTPPPQSKQPTLREGDDSPDGWVEYAQKLLSDAGFKLTVNGKFDGTMRKQVLAFQKAQKCQQDGTIGNETWSMLRDAKVKDAVGVDGRPPHSFEEKGAQARFWTEDNESASYSTGGDVFTFVLASPGEQKIDDFFVTLKVTQKDGTAHTHKQAIGSESKPSPDGQGSSYKVRFKGFRKLFKLGTTDPSEWTVDAYLDAEIGGDEWHGAPAVAA